MRFEVHMDHYAGHNKGYRIYDNKLAKWASYTHYKSKEKAEKIADNKNRKEEKLGNPLKERKVSCRFCGKRIPLRLAKKVLGASACAKCAKAKLGNPSKSSVIKKLRKGIRGTIKLVKGRLIIKT